MRAAIQRREVDERRELSEDEVLQTIQKMVKQCKDSIEQFTQGGRDDLAEKERANIAVLETYLPAKLSDQEISDLIQAAIAETGAKSMKDMGKVMGMASGQLAGKADGKDISNIVRELLG